MNENNTCGPYIIGDRNISDWETFQKAYPVACVLPTRMVLCS